MDSQIYLINFNKKEFYFFAHEFYLKKFAYFDCIFSGETSLPEEGVINLTLDYHFKNSISEQQLSSKEIEKKIFDKNIVQLALNIAYGIPVKSKLSSMECYDFVMLMDFLQYIHMDNFENIIYELYNSKEDFNALISNHYNNHSANRIKKKLLSMCIVDKFKRQLFHFGSMYFRITIALNDNNGYYIDECSVDSENDNNYRVVSSIGEWIKYTVEKFLKLFSIDVCHFEFVPEIKNNMFVISNGITVNSDVAPIRFCDTINYGKKVCYIFNVDLNTFVNNIILKKYLD